ncbi:MAG: glycosyltransferase [Candidatus Omnitrophica bacterium]|nr:glycosyltransferase [Candidatus Omnitrophota bacterium]
MVARQKNILIYIHGMLPLPGEIATGNGIRAQGLAEGLKTKGHNVHYCTREDFVTRNFKSSNIKNFHVFRDKKEFMKTIELVKPVIVIFEQGDGLEYIDSSIDIPIVADLFAPRILESLFLDSKIYRDKILNQMLQFRKVDFFLCSTERQKYVLASILFLLGFYNKKLPIGVVPISTSPILPYRSFVRKFKDLTFVYGGVFWPWQNPVKCLAHLLKTLEKYEKVRLVIFGGEYKYKLDNFKYKNSVKEFSNSSKLIFKKMIPYDKLLHFYRQSHIAFDIMERNIEREVSFSFRVIDYLQCGLPVLTANYSELSKDIDIYKAGWVVDDAKPEKVKNILEKILSNPGILEIYSDNAIKLIEDKYTWDKTIKPLEDFCKKPNKNNILQDFFNLSQKTIKKQEKDLVETRQEVEKLEFKISEYQKLLNSTQTYAAKLEKEKKTLYDEFLVKSKGFEERTLWLESSQKTIKKQEKDLVRFEQEIGRIKSTKWYKLYEKVSSISKKKKT